MDYKNLVTALKEDDVQKANELIKALRPRLIAFLRVHMNSNQADAEDCAQESLLIAIDVIKRDQLNDPEQVVSYILSICRNNYLTMQQKHREERLEESNQKRQAPQQLQSLLDEEQEQLLNWCMDQLQKEYQRFMQYWFDHPDVQTERVADHFDISISNAWTRKHRLIKKLNECYRKKSKL